MKKYNIGFIGSGKMAGAIIKGLLKSERFEPDNIIASQIDAVGLEENSQKLGVKITLDNSLVVQNSDIIVLAVKPSQVSGVLEEISQNITSQKLVVSVAAGITTDFIAKELPVKSRIIRIMPNTPALLGEGMSVLVAGANATNEDLKIVEDLFSTIGKTLVLQNEMQMDIVTAISGSGPAFFYKVINDIARAGEKLGLDYKKSLLLSIQTALGSAKMALNREVAMEDLISNVATSGGCTRVGVDVMEDYNTQELFFNVIEKTSRKAFELGKNT